MAKPETKLCKHCKTEIPYDAKICPQCRKRVKGGKLKWILLAVAAVLVVTIAFGGNSDDTTKVGEVTPTEPIIDSEPASTTADTTAEATSDSAPTEEKTCYKVGDILQDGDLKIVYIASGIYEEENDILAADDGFQYIYLKFSMENTSAKSDVSISSFSFDCYADGFSMESYYGGEGDLSATLSAGRNTVGCVYYAVPVDAEQIEVEYTPNVFSNKKITFAYEGEYDSGYVPESSGVSGNALSVGETAEIGNLRFTYLSCEEYTSDNMFLVPKDGYRFISCEFEVENIGKRDELISTFSFDCYADGTNCESSFVRDNTLDANLSTGRKAKGTVTFEVPVDASVVEVEYLDNVLTSSRIVFDASI